MKKARKCRKCGCTETKACIIFDERGRGFPCCWVEIASDGSVELGSLCNACAPNLGRPFSAFVGQAVVVAPQLAGMIARPR